MCYLFGCDPIVKLQFISFNFKFQDCSIWILTVSIILYNQVTCSSDYEVVHTYGTGLKSDPAYHHDDYNEDSANKQKEYDLSGFKRISPTPEFTLSHLYISPEDAQRHFTRSHSQSKSNYVDDGYSAFLNKNFQDNDDDHEVKNHDDDDSDGGNSKYRQKNYETDEDDDEEEKEVYAKYRHVPTDGENNEHHYSYTYNDGDDEFGRIRSLPQKEETETKKNSKNCKVIQKGKAMCRLCKDPVSGAHSESCSFSSAPPEKKYAYIKKEKYIS